MKMFFYGELDTYVIPGVNGIVTLGGSRSYDSENMKLCPYESAAIRERCETLVPSLKDAEILRQEVGLRPHREGGVRVGEGNRLSNHSKAIVSIWTMKIVYINRQIADRVSFCRSYIIMDTVVTEFVWHLELL